MSLDHVRFHEPDTRTMRRRVVACARLADDSSRPQATSRQGRPDPAQCGRNEIAMRRGRIDMLRASTDPTSVYKRRVGIPSWPDPLARSALENGQHREGQGLRNNERNL